MKTCTHPPRGFSLVELAIVLSILGLLSIGALSALRIQTERARLAETRELLADAREALLNFAAVSGHLPCPAPDAGGAATASCSVARISRKDRRMRRMEKRMRRTRCGPEQPKARF